MHDAKASTLSKIEVGQLILVTPEQDMKARIPGQLDQIRAREFARPKDKTAEAKRVTAKAFAPDQWSGKVWTLTLDDGTKTEPRYGTAHVYVFDVPAWLPPAAQGSTAAALEITQLAEADVDTESGTKRVTIDANHVVRVKDWTGGNVFETTPHGLRVHINPEGIVTVIEDDGTERPAVITPDHEPAKAGMTDAEAAKVLASERCGQCKGYGVVRKRGSQAGKAYRTLNGAEQATANGNSVTCPACKGEALVPRAA